MPDRGASALVPEPAAEFIREHRRIVTEEPFLVGLGAVGPGHEWAIPRMFAAVIPGLQRAGFTPEEINYFTLHVAQDVDHGTWLEEALLTFGNTEEARSQIRRGAMLSLEARDRFWSGVQSAIVRYRQPRAVRSDGAKPRATAEEFALFLWDSLPLARRVEAAVQKRREKQRPTLEALVEEGRQ